MNEKVKASLIYFAVLIMYTGVTGIYGSQHLKFSVVSSFLFFAQAAEALLSLLIYAAKEWKRNSHLQWKTLTGILYPTPNRLKLSIPALFQCFTSILALRNTRESSGLIHEVFAHSTLFYTVFLYKYLLGKKISRSQYVGIILLFLSLIVSQIDMYKEKDFWGNISIIFYLNLEGIVDAMQHVLLELFYNENLDTIDTKNYWTFFLGSQIHLVIFFLLNGTVPKMLSQTTWVLLVSTVVLKITQKYLLVAVGSVEKILIDNLGLVIVSALLLVMHPEQEITYKVVLPIVGVVFSTFVFYFEIDTEGGSQDERYSLTINNKEIYVKFKDLE